MRHRIARLFSILTYDQWEKLVSTMETRHNRFEPRFSWLRAQCSTNELSRYPLGVLYYT